MTAAPTANTDVWVWDPVDGDHRSFAHPAEVPAENEAIATARFVKKVIGPSYAKLSKAKLLDRKGHVTMIARPDGSNHEVARARVLPWYEGLLVLQELEARQTSKSTQLPSWFTPDLKKLLEEERTKYSRSGAGLSGGLYVEKRLLDTAVTGARVYDKSDKEWQYRREKLDSNESVLKQSAESQEKDGFWPIRDIKGYLPPWEAFCHERCGFYQDFYQVCWGSHFAEVDYTPVENGVHGVPGATWEPDECLPPHLDAFRIREKRSWSKRKKEEDVARVLQASKRQKTGNSATPSPATASPGAKAVSKTPPKAAAPTPPQKPPPALAKLTRDGFPLCQDMKSSKCGHDLRPPDMSEQNGIRTGWPRRAEEYPPGYGVAGPPGFCLPDCDCMDDQRPQKSWETNKAWIEEAQRSAAVILAVNALDKLSAVRRRGQVSSQCYFETAAVLVSDKDHIRAARDLAREVETQIKIVLQDIPEAAISDSSNPVTIPALAFLKPAEDYEPLTYNFADAKSSSWAQLGVNDGQLLVPSGGPKTRPATLKIEFCTNEDAKTVTKGTAECKVTDGTSATMATATVSVANRFIDQKNCQLTRNGRVLLQAQLENLFDFETKTAKETSLAYWLDTMAVFLRMVRTTAFSNVCKTEANTPKPATPSR